MRPKTCTEHPVLCKGHSTLSIVCWVPYTTLCTLCCAPHAMHPAPHTMDTVPHTLHPMPWALCPTL